jgi:predicted permease
VTVADAQRRLDEVAGQLSQGGVSVEGPIRVEPLFAETFHLLNATLMRSLTGAVAAVLLIAAVNVAGMILARGLTRRAEVSVRYALGASTPRIIRQLLTETMLLAGAGGVAGVAVAVWSFDALLVVFPDLVPRAEAPPLSLEVLTASAALTIVAGLGVGLYPALRLSRSHGAAFLAQAHPAGHGTARVRSGRWMVGAEVALAVALLCVAGLLVRNISLVAAADMGVDPSSFLSFDVEPIEEDETRRTGQYAALLDAIRNLPEVEAAGGRWTIGTAFSVAVAGDGPAERAIRRAVSAGYLEALGAEAIQGSLPTEQDAARGVPIVVINQEAARRFFPDGPAVGRTLTVQRAAFKVVGVVRDVRLQDPLRLNAPELYVVQPGGPDWPVMTVVVRPLGPAPRLPERLREAATALSVPAVVGPVRTGGSWLWENAAVEMRGRYAMLLSLFAGLGVLLSAVGIFGVTAYAVARRTREIGVRLALGSSPARAIREMMRETAVPMGLGIVAGLFGAALASRAIAHLLVGVSPHDPLTYLVVAVMFAGLAMFAAWVPARRAARVDPVHALRTE